MGYHVQAGAVLVALADLLHKQVTPPPSFSVLRGSICSWFQACAGRFLFAFILAVTLTPSISQGIGCPHTWSIDSLPFERTSPKFHRKGWRVRLLRYMLRLVHDGQVLFFAGTSSMLPALLAFRVMYARRS